MSTRPGSTAVDEELAIRPARSRARRRSPSRASKRLLAAFVALVGAAIACWLAAYQLGLASTPWDPIFGDGTRKVLTSAFSRSLPFPDAALGAVAYLAEIVALAWGGVDRYRTKPFVVLVYAAIAATMAAGSAGLVLVQAFAVHAFCTLCLISAAISFVLVIPAATELAAAARQYVHRTRAAPA